MSATVSVHGKSCLRLHISRLVAMAAIVSGAPAHADLTISSSGKILAFGDFRLRYENDWDSQQADGAPRPDRDRIRIRGRLGLRLQPMEKLSVVARLRTGSNESQQSPHITIADFDDNPHGDQDIVFDQWYAEARGAHGSIWAGRRDFPFWKQNELFWDDDATIAGAAFARQVTVTPGFEIRAGAFALPDGAEDFNGWMGAGQAIVSGTMGAMDFTLAGGLFAIDGKRGAEFLGNGNGARDYFPGVLSAQARTEFLGHPFSLGLDLMHNFTDYSAKDADPFTAANHDQKDAVVAQARLGSLGNASDWQVGYSYAYVQTLAVPASYAQDDWHRFGSATQTDASDFRGHEFLAAYALTRAITIVGRLYMVEAITTQQDGSRFRLDFNFRF